MKQYWTLLKVQLNNWLGLSALRYGRRDDPKKFRKTLLILGVIIFAVAELVGLYGIIFSTLLDGAIAIGQPDMVLGMAFTAAQLITLLLGVFVVLGVMFFAKDGPFLAALPVRSWQVFLSKLTVVYLYMLAYMLVGLVVPLGLYAWKVSVSIGYIVKALLLCVLVPILPLTLASLLGTALMSFSALSRHRDALTMVGSLVLVLAIVVGQNVLMASIPLDDPSAMAGYVSQNQAAIVAVGRAFPPSIWASLALVTPGWAGIGWLAMSVLVSAAALGLMLVLANGIYMRTILAQQETAKRNVSISKAWRSVGVHSPAGAYFWREWRMVLRTPIYAINSLFGIIMGPLMLVLPLLTGSGAMQGGTGDLMALMQSVDGRFVLLGLMGWMTFIAMVNPAASTAISREGKAFWMSLMVPVPPAEQIRGKFYMGYLIVALGMATTAVAAVVLGIDPLVVVLSLVAGLAINLPMTALSLVLDAARPKLEWNTPEEAIKQNMNSLLAMLVDLIIAAVLAGAAAGLFALGAGPVLLALGITAAALVMGVLSYRWMLRRADISWDQIREG